MPLTRTVAWQGGASDEELFIALREVVPAAFNSEEGPLTPGSIEFVPGRVEQSRFLTVACFIEVEALYYKDRENLDERAEAVRAAMKELFPWATFAVWPKLVTAGWASDSTDPEFDGDMSMEAAIDRAGDALLALS